MDCHVCPQRTESKNEPAREKGVNVGGGGGGGEKECVGLGECMLPVGMAQPVLVKTQASAIYKINLISSLDKKDFVQQ